MCACTWAAHLALWAAKVDAGQVLGQASVVEEYARLHDLLCQDTCHRQHRPPRVHKLCLPVPARATGIPRHQPNSEKPMSSVSYTTALCE